MMSSGGGREKRQDWEVFFLSLFKAFLFKVEGESFDGAKIDFMEL
jgi:hypothetical protein